VPTIRDEFFKQALEPLPATGRLPLDIVMSVQFDTRRDAARAGEATYFTGQPCRHGHLSDRYTSTGNCTECLRSASVASYARVKTELLRPDLPVIPECIAGKGKATLKPCMTCPRMNAGCKGSQYSQVGNRAVQAFPDYPPLPRGVARARRYQVFMPNHECPSCGLRTWRTARSDECCGCGSK
jgi:hypothetical protein